MTHIYVNGRYVLGDPKLIEEAKKTNIGVTNNAWAHGIGTTPIKEVVEEVVEENTTVEPSETTYQKYVRIIGKRPSPAKAKDEAYLNECIEKHLANI